MKRAAVIALVALVGCREERERPRPPPVPEPAPPPWSDTQATPAPQPEPPVAPEPPTTPPPLTDLPPPCLAAAEPGTIVASAKRVTFCQSDQTCAIWDRKSKKLRVERRYHVEEEAGEPDEGDEEEEKDEEDQERARHEDGRVEVCPPSRACFEFVPTKDRDESIVDLQLSDDGAVAAVAIAGAGGARGRVELWSTKRASLVKRIAVPVPDPELEWEIGAWFVGDAVLVTSKHGDRRWNGAIHGLDGRRRGALGGGSQHLEPNELLWHEGRRVALFDWGAEGKPYAVILQDLGTGKVIARLEIPFVVDDGEEDVIEWTDVGDDFVGLTQWGPDGLRLDLVDARRGKRETFAAPGC